MRGLGSVVMAGHLCALFKGRFEKYTEQFALANCAIFRRDIAPHVCDDNDVLQCRVTAKVTEPLEILSGDSGEPIAGDAVDLDDTGKCSASISVKEFSLEDRDATNDGLHSRGGQESGNHLQNICIAL